MNSLGRILAIDFGERRLGVAVSDQSRVVAQPLTVVERTEVREDIEHLARIIKDSGVNKIVVGNPRTLAGAEGAQSAVVRRFVSELRRAIDVPIVSFDERLSSKEARASLAAAGIRGRSAKGVIDKVAAALFLQSYLDKEAGRA